ncbi:MAG: hypothetical protein EZS28_048033 [Streblomastix strix]|uniref:Uncharacterized protein n=1 Tax=Streblomastix strix TaxID=222440 RepID=A0A5J4TFQ7_9EUKA|nr:MAG: hypothetical protein EZS28_048033 [Streblomastix strix]
MKISPKTDVKSIKLEKRPKLNYTRKSKKDDKAKAMVDQMINEDTNEQINEQINEKRDGQIIEEKFEQCINEL